MRSGANVVGKHYQTTLLNRGLDIMQDGLVFLNKPIKQLAEVDRPRPYSYLKALTGFMEAVFQDWRTTVATAIPSVMNDAATKTIGSTSM
jgi:hypothetical protein